jgi:hypothetical protein
MAKKKKTPQKKSSQTPGIVPPMQKSNVYRKGEKEATGKEEQRRTC